MKVNVFILKDSVLLEKQRREAAKTLFNQGVPEAEATKQAYAKVSDVQCTYVVETDSQEVNPRSIVMDIVGDKQYRTQLSF